MKGRALVSAVVFGILSWGLLALTVLTARWVAVHLLWPGLGFGLGYIVRGRRHAGRGEPGTRLPVTSHETATAPGSPSAFRYSTGRRYAFGKPAPYDFEGERHVPSSSDSWVTDYDFEEER